MNQDELTEKIEAYLVEHLGLEAEYVRANNSIFTSGMLDSLEVVNLIVFMDEKLGIKLDPLDISFEQLDTIENIVTNALKSK